MRSALEFLECDAREEGGSRPPAAPSSPSRSPSHRARAGVARPGRRAGATVSVVKAPAAVMVGKTLQFARSRSPALRRLAGLRPDQEAWPRTGRLLSRPWMLRQRRDAVEVPQRRADLRVRQLALSVQSGNDAFAAALVNRIAASMSATASRTAWRSDQHQGEGVAKAKVHITDAFAIGVQVVAGAETARKSGLFFAPPVLIAVTQEMTIAREDNSSWSQPRRRRETIWLHDG